MSADRDEVVFGVHAVSQAVEVAGERIRELYLQQGRDDATVRLLAEAARARGIPVQTVPKARLTRLTGSARHQGVAARVRPAAMLDERGLADFLVDRANPLLLALDGVQDPHNLGACLRGAAAAGADAVIVPRNRAVGITGAVRKVASGAAEIVPIARVTNLARTLRMLADRRIRRCGAVAGEGREVFATPLAGPVCLVLGGEARGLRRLTREHCDELFHIPMNPAVESLNVAVAAGICLFEAVRQRRAV